MEPLEVDLDAIMEDLGRVGKYQIKHFLWILIPVVLCSLHATTYIFTTDDVLYRCHITECDGSDKVFDPPWIDNAIPQGEQCSRYLSSGNSSQKRTDLEESCSANMFDKDTEVGCTQYVFKDDNTFIEEMDIPCRDWKRTIVGTARNIGNLIGLPIMGAFSDRFGRRHCLIISAIMAGIFGVAKSLATNYSTFLSLEIIESVGGSGAYSSAFILAIELLTPSTIVLGSTLISTYFSIGQILLGFIAWGFPFWRTFLQVIYAPAIIVLAFYWISDESIKWLIYNRRYQEAMNILKKIATVNEKTITNKALESLQYNLDNAENFEKSDTKTDLGINKNTVPAWRLVLKSRIIMLRVLKVSVWWITCTFCLYGLSIMSTVLPGNSYVNFIYSGLTEIPSQVVSYYGLKYFGRKKTLFVSFVSGGICVLCVAFIPKGLETLSLIFYLFGKFFVLMATNSVYLYTSELFPTPLRHSLFATCSMIGRIGSIMAPQTLLLVKYMEQLPLLLFASTCLLSAVLMIGSPETVNRNLPKTIEDAENILN